LTLTASVGDLDWIRTPVWTSAWLRSSRQSPSHGGSASSTGRSWWQARSWLRFFSFVA